MVILFQIVLVLGTILCFETDSCGTSTPSSLLIFLRCFVHHTTLVGLSVNVTIFIISCGSQKLLCSHRYQSGLAKKKRRGVASFASMRQLAGRAREPLVFMKARAAKPIYKSSKSGWRYGSHPVWVSFSVWIRFSTPEVWFVSGCDML